MLILLSQDNKIKIKNFVRALGRLFTKRPVVYNYDTKKPLNLLSGFMNF
ncbi:hypothetical protein ZONE111904_02380 [Zobellia nedashkovskayae]